MTQVIGPELDERGQSELLSFCLSSAFQVGLSQWIDPQPMLDQSLFEERGSTTTKNPH